MKDLFLSRIISTSWQLSRQHAREILAPMISKLRAERPATDLDGEPLPRMQILGDLAIVPIRGVLMIDVPDWVKKWGVNITDANDIETEIGQALADPAVSMIVLDINSPGGESIAGGKLFDLVETALRKKAVFAYAADGAQMCSAAYNAAAPAIGIFSGKYATIGSIGSFSVQLDWSGYWEQMGISVEVFRSGDLKGIGEDKLTDQQRAFLQAEADKWGGRIRANVVKYRTMIDPADLDGRWFNGDDAAARYFTHGLAKNLPAAINKFRSLL